MIPEEYRNNDELTVIPVTDISTVELRVTNTQLRQINVNPDDVKELLLSQAAAFAKVAKKKVFGYTIVGDRHTGAVLFTYYMI